MMRADSSSAVCSHRSIGDFGEDFGVYSASNIVKSARKYLTKLNLVVIIIK